MLCSEPPASKSDSRYTTLGLNDTAQLDHGAMWPASFAATTIRPAKEKRITDLVRRGVGGLRRGDATRSRSQPEQPVGVAKDLQARRVRGALEQGATRRVAVAQGDASIQCFFDALVHRVAQRSVQ